MSTSTPNLGLVKPAATEKYNIAVFNTNSDNIDTAVKSDRDRLTSLENRMTAEENFTGDDTGWVALAMGSGWTAVGGYPMQVRRIGKQVWLHGMAVWASGLLANTTVVGALATQFRPPSNRWLNLSQGTDSAKTKAHFLVQPDGQVLCPSASYYEGAPTVGITFDITGSWLVD